MKAPVLIVVQARLGSTRLPGKVLRDLGGKPMLLRMLERLYAVKSPATVVVATTTDPQDERIETLCRASGVEVFRGHPTDLLDRHYQAAVAFGAEAVAKIPSDCPLIDPAAVDNVLARFAQGDCDYASNLHPASWPDGNDVEVMRVTALQTAWREARLPMEREHTTPFIWERPERFRLANVAWGGEAPNGDRDCSMSHRWTVDYQEDYAAIRAIFEALHPRNPLFGVEDILRLLARKPEVAAINACHRGVNWYRHHLHQLRTVDARSTRSDRVA
ncbi:MAG: glycosyltransferase family protein [Methylotetracoccus sp.]|nr:glycosyltransferase family protein [Methylotetracoccus sp.]